MTPRDPATAIVYHVRLANPDAHLIEVSCRIESPSPDGQLLSLPAWIPGSYLVRDYARHVVGIQAESRGEDLPIRKVDKSTWRVAPAPAELVVRMRVYAADPSVRGAWLDRDSGFFNGVCLFLRVHQQEQSECVVHIEPPDGAPDWRLATTLERLTGAPGEFGAFRAFGYDEVIDHPCLMGTLAVTGFEAGGVPHAVVVTGAPEADHERMARDLATLCSTHIAFFAAPSPMKHYLFLVRARGEGYGGLEHRDSSALLCRREDLPRPGGGPVDSGYRRWLGLASHEYFHAWHVKRIRPAVLAAADLTAEAYTRQLWVFEGITSYYDDLALLRSGLIGVDSYLELLGRAITQLYRTAGRRHQTLEEASFDAWIKFYRPDENSANTTVSYYLKGGLVALALDLEIRLRTGGRHSLDDVMRAAWQEFGETGAGMPEGAFERLVEETCGVDLEAFFQQALRSTLDPPVGILLAQFGIRLQLRGQETEADAGGCRGRREDRPRPWLGMRTEPHRGRVRLTTVTEGGPAQQAGLTAGDELVAIGGHRAGADNYEALLDRLTVGTATPCHVFRDHTLVMASLVPAEPPRDTCYLVLDAEAAPETAARRAAWLHLPTGRG